MRPEKQLLVDEIKEDIEKYISFVVMKYEGLTANQANDFRRQIEKTGGNVSMVKKRVLNKVIQDVGIDLHSQAFEGHIALVFVGEDAVTSTKTVFEFSKENGENIAIVGGHLDGAILTAEQIKTLSELPSKDVMRAQFIGTLEAPLTQTLAVMETLLTSVPHCLENKSKL